MNPTPNNHKRKPCISEDCNNKDDFYRYNYLCSLAQMFSAGDRFSYRINRIGSVIEIHLLSPDGKKETAIFNFDDPEERKAEEIRRIISLIVNFIS